MPPRPEGACSGASWRGRIAARPHAARGFTLLEVMVALAVLAIAMAAVIKGVSGNVSNMSYMRDRTLAHWVAMNEIVDIQAHHYWPDPPKDEGKSLMADRQWFWTVIMTKTPDPAIRRIEIEVRAKRDTRESLAHLISYLSRPGDAKVATP